MSRKRKRDIDESSIGLIETYNDLAHEDEIVRLKAAQSLLQRFSSPNATTPEQISTALSRLLKGLCSSRKAARIGFSIALTEFLSQIFTFTTDQRGGNASQIVQLLDKESAASGSVSRQDERDHYIGRLFGAEALLKSGVFFTPKETLALEQLLDLICVLSTKKPWLRQECGWSLYSCILNLEPQKHAHVVETVLRSLLVHRLIRTPEGVAIWLAVRQKFPAAKLPNYVWRHDNPLDKKEKTLLAKVMRDATSKQDNDDNAQQAQGSAIWNSRLHFAWTAVLDVLFANCDVDGTPKSKKVVSFEQFWTEVVDESLFTPSSSSERKHTGFLICTKAIATAPTPLLLHILKGNVKRSLTNQLANGERLLHRAAQKVVQNLVSRARESVEASVVTLRALCTSEDLSGSFDQVTKTKTSERVITNAPVQALTSIVDVLSAYLAEPGTFDEKQAQTTRRTAADLLVVIFNHSMNPSLPLEISSDVRNIILKLLVQYAYFASTFPHAPKDSLSQPAITASTRQLVQARLLSCLERAMALPDAMSVLQLAVMEIRLLEQNSKLHKIVVEMDSEVKNAVHTAWTVLEGLQKNLEAVPSLQALKLLFLLSILQVYNGEPDAVQILEELESYTQEYKTTDEDGNDSIIEILLSFSSKPSKFLRRIILQVFQSFAPSITASGLESLTRILQTDENAKGQQDLFDAQPLDDDEEISNGIDDSSNDSDEEMLDSDVEAISQASSAISTDSESESEADEEDKQSAAEEEVENEDDDDAVSEDSELAAFNAKLAAALGTRKGEDDLAASDTSGSDSPMSDSEMEALDTQLASVFRARKDDVNKKKEHKSAKGNIVQFKNRVLDLIEVYLKQEHLNPLSLTLITPLLVTARKTKAKQISDRSCTILREYCSRCKGQKNTPLIPNLTTPLDILSAIHQEVSTHRSSNLHSSACSQTSILLVKVLASQGNEGLEMAVDAYAELRKRQVRDKECRVLPGFFTDWGNWCAQWSQSLRK